ncbi:MAG: peptidase domain-containing ABC transporter [Gammaproteobacteria bacterium]|nr:peptidase domain-containing ABC transporter [Gammaproteobacteria bacterium]
MKFRLQPDLLRRTPVILQSEAAECALAALCMVARHHGKDIDFQQARQQFSASLKGATVGDLVSMSQILGFAARPLRLEPEEMKELSCPAVLHWRMNHFVILCAVKTRGIVIHDPAVGRVEVPWREVNDAFTGVAVELVPSTVFERGRASMEIRFADLWKALPGLQSFAALFFLFSMAARAIALLIPYLFQLVIDDALVSSDTGILLAVVFGLAFLMTFEAVINAVRTWGVAVASARLSQLLTTSLMRHLLALPLPFFERRHTGDLLTRIGSLDAVRSILATSVVGLCVDGTVVLLTATVLCIYDATLGLLAVGMLILLALLRLALYSHQRQLDDTYLHEQAGEQTCTIETLRTLASVRAVNGESQRLARMSERITRRIASGLDVARFQVNTTLVESLLQGALHITIIWFAANKVMHTPELFSLGMLFAFMAWKGQFSDRAGSLVGHLISCRLLELHLARLADITATTGTVITDRLGTTDRLSGDIQIQRLSFRHSPMEAWVLQELDVLIPAGRMTAIIGASGTGKTTLAKLLLGLCEPEGGSIAVGGVPLCRENMVLWRRSTGVVLQDDQLLAGTVADNIAFQSGDMDLERVQQAAEFAGLHEEICRMPMGYLSLVGDLGSSLSSGQKQRLLIARALYRKPDVLLLDEGSAHLDPVSEAKLAELLAAIPCTRIVIAHRPAWVQYADQILELTDGRLVDVTGQWRARPSSVPVSPVIGSLHRDSSGGVVPV